MVSLSGNRFVPFHFSLGSQIEIKLCTRRALERTSLKRLIHEKYFYCVSNNEINNAHNIRDSRRPHVVSRRRIRIEQRNFLLARLSSVTSVVRIESRRRTAEHEGHDSGKKAVSTTLYLDLRTTESFLHNSSSTHH